MILERFKVPAKDVVRVPEAALRRTVTQIFEKLGVSPEDAAEGADVLTMTDLRGVETHGVSNMLRMYVQNYKSGQLEPKPGCRLVRQTPGTAVIDAERRLGIMVGPKAMRLAIEKAKNVGVGVVTVYNSGHFGAIGHYAMQAAQHDMVGVCFTAAGLAMVPTFGAKPLLGTNPIAIAAPARREAPMLFDVATSAIAGNKIRLAIRVGSPLLPGWVTDKEGTPIMEEKPVFNRDEFYQAPLGRNPGAGVTQGLRLRPHGGGPGDHARRRHAHDAVAPERLQEPLRRVQHRGVHRRGPVQGLDGRDARDPAHRDAGAGPGARALSGAVRARRGGRAPRQRHPAPQGSHPVVRGRHGRDGPRPAGNPLRRQPMKIKRVEHIAIAVTSLKQSIDLLRDTFGLPLEYEEQIGQTRLAMLPVGQSYIELLEGQGPESGVTKWISEKGTGLFHICFEVEDIDGALAELKAKGVKLRDETPRIGHGGARIAFIDPSSTGDVLIELAELPAGHGAHA